MALPLKREFLAEGVIVNIPGQVRPIDVQKLALPAIEALPPVSIGFHPFRLVINLKLVDAAQPEKEVLEFDPPIEVRIHYTKADIDLANAVRRPLCLGFWDGNRWIRFTAKKHNFRLEPEASPAAGGWGIFKVSIWGDPPHAWGT